MYTTLGGPRSAASVSWRLDEEDEVVATAATTKKTTPAAAALRLDMPSPLSSSSSKIVSVDEKDSPIKTVVAGQRTVFSALATSNTNTNNTNAFTAPATSPPGKRDVFARLMKTAASSMFDEEEEEEVVEEKRENEEEAEEEKGVALPYSPRLEDYDDKLLPKEEEKQTVAASAIVATVEAAVTATAATTTTTTTTEEEEEEVEADLQLEAKQVLAIDEMISRDLCLEDELLASLILAAASSSSSSSASPTNNLLSTSEEKQANESDSSFDLAASNLHLAPALFGVPPIEIVLQDVGYAEAASNLDRLKRYMNTLEQAMSFAAVSILEEEKDRDLFENVVARYDAHVHQGLVAL